MGKRSVISDLPAVLEVYAAKDGYRWRVRTRNHRIVATSGEAYTRRSDARAAFWRFFELLVDEKD